MKIISLNTAQAIYFDAFISFLQEQKDTTDIFCFQEVSNGIRFASEGRKNLLQDIATVLQDFNVIINDYEKYLDGCIAVCVHKKHRITNVIQGVLAEHIIDHEQGNMWDVGLYLGGEITIEKKTFSLMSIHGVWHPGDKLENNTRIQQKNKILELLDNSSSPTLLLGDFNLHPETDTISKISSKLNNLNTLFSITDTRGPGTRYFATEQYQPYADYAFASKTFIIESYTTEETIISDHKALLLDVTL